MSENKITLTPEQIEELRQAAIKENAEKLAEGKARVLARVDEVIAFLQVNREHIAAIGVVAIAREDSSCVDPGDGRAADGLCVRSSAHGLYRDALAANAKDLTREAHSNPLAALLG